MFTDRQLWKLRSGLECYRLKKRLNGRPPSWEKVREAIEFSPLTTYFLPLESAQIRKAEGEAIRRFTLCNTDGMEPPGRLEDIKNFLISEKLIDANEFSDDTNETLEAVKLSQLLGAQAGPAARSLKDFPDHIYLTLTGQQIRELFELRVSGRLNDNLVIIDEVIKVYRHEEGAIELTFSRTRRGYAFLYTADRRLTIFFKDLDSNDVIHYAEFGRVRPDGWAKFAFIRHPAPEFQNSPYARGRMKYYFEAGYMRARFTPPPSLNTLPENEDD